MPLPQSFQELIHNRPAMIGLAAAGGVGLVVWIRRNKSDTSNAASSAGSTGASGTYGVPSFDTSATDLAGYLSDFSGGLSNQLQDWLKQAQGTLNPPPESSPSPSPSPVPTPGGANNNKRPSITVKPGDSVVNTITSLQHQGVNITYDQLVKLNPTFVSNINWAKANQPRAWDAFRSPATYRLF